MKKSVFASVKPLAMATAVAAGTTVSMIAVALPGGDTSGANGVVTETLCHNAADMTIASGSRSVTTATGTCQVRTLPPTKGLVLTEGASAGGTVADSSPLVNAGGELYETFVGGNRQGVVLLTPNRSLAVTRSSSFASGADGSVSFELGAAVQPSTGLQSSWLTGTYNIMNRVHDFQDPASGLTASPYPTIGTPYAAPNEALGERNYTSSYEVTFNGDGTCSFATDSHQSFVLTKDPMVPYFGEMDNGCTVGGGNCGQNDGDNYVSQGVVNLGSTGSLVGSGAFDFGDGNADGEFGADGGCTYTVAAGEVDVTYTLEKWSGGAFESSTTWTTKYNVSADLRYLVAAEPGTEAHIGGYAGENEGATLAVGVRTGAGDVSGKTYLFNSTLSTNAVSTSNTASYEAPASPQYQTEECITRGSIAFNGDGSCDVQSVSSCTGRAMSGYEETSAGNADGTITDSLTAADGTDTAPSSCSWTNTGGLVVTMGVTDPDNAPITMTYTGDVSDNGEALVLQGIYNIQGPSPDTENPPLLPQQKFNILSYMVAQEYQGSLAGDADSDGLNNYGEFTWADDVTPAATGSVKTDYDADGDSDVLLRATSTGAFRKFDVQAGSVSGNTGFALYASTGWSQIASPDVDGDGDKDVLMRDNASGAWRLFTVQGGAIASNSGFALYSNLDYTLQAVADVDGDGDDDVLMRSTSTGAWRLFTVQAGAVAGNSGFALYAANDYTLQFAEDVDADGDADVAMRSTSTGAWRLFTVQAGAVAGNSGLALYANTGQVLGGAGDLDGDGDADVLMRDSSTGAWRKFDIQAGAVASNSGFAIYSNLDYTLQKLGDFDADGDADVLMRSTSTGAWRKFDVQAGAVAGNAGFALYAATDYTMQK